MFGGVGSTWGENFYVGMQNGSKLEIWLRGILTHTLEVKLRPFEIFPYVYIGSHAVAMFSATCYVRGGASRTHKRDDLNQLLTKLKFMLPACIVWFYYASSSIIWWFPDNFFFYLVYKLALKKMPQLLGTHDHDLKFSSPNLYSNSYSTGIQDYLCQLDARDISVTEDYAEEPGTPASLEFLQVASWWWMRIHYKCLYLLSKLLICIFH